MTYRRMPALAVTFVVTLAVMLTAAWCALLVRGATMLIFGWHATVAAQRPFASPHA
jgi:hypothetical protein